MVRIVRRIEEAPTLLIKRIASETDALLASGAPIINLSQGCPNLPMFEAARDAAVASIQSRRLPYTSVPGEDSVRETCANFLNTVVLGLSGAENKEPPVYTSSHVCVTNGAVGAVYCALAVQVESSDDVVASPLPAYGLYRSDTVLLGGTFVGLPAGCPEDGFALKPSDIRSAFETHGSKLRCLVLCSPNNPTGKCFSDGEAKRLADELERQLESYPDFSVLLDEVYTGIAGSHTSILRHASPRLRQACFVTLSASKGLGGCPGARAGFVAVADGHVAAQLAKVQMATGANVSVPSQKILDASLRHVLADADRVLGEIHRFYRQRTDLVCSRLESLGKKCLDDERALCPRRPEGTFYVLARFECLGATDLEIQQRLRDAYKMDGVSHGVALVPLSAFDMDASLCMVRICCAVDMDTLEAAMGVVEAVVKQQH